MLCFDNFSFIIICIHYRTNYYFAHGMAAKYCDDRVCLSVHHVLPVLWMHGVDAACVQFGSREKEFPTKGKNLLLFHLKFALKSLVLFSC